MTDGEYCIDGSLLRTDPIRTDAMKIVPSGKGYSGPRTSKKVISKPFIQVYECINRNVYEFQLSDLG